MTLSVDKLVIDYKISPVDGDGLARLLEILPLRNAVEVKHWTSFRMGTFRENITVSFQDGNSFWLGVGLNAAKPLFGRVRLEANPNKCIFHSSFLEVLGWLNNHSKPLHTTIRRFDLAIDCFVERENARLIKDRRTYSQIVKSHNNQTEYLGAKSSTEGRVKLYNKTIEAGLSYPLTRLELTLDPSNPYGEINWPRAYIIQTQQTSMGEIMRLTDTERFVLGALLSGYGCLTDLGRKTRAKLERVMAENVKWIVISEKDYIQVLQNTQDILHYPEKDIGVDGIDTDRPPKPLPAWVLDAKTSRKENALLEAESSGT